MFFEPARERIFNPTTSPAERRETLADLLSLEGCKVVPVMGRHGSMVLRLEDLDGMEARTSPVVIDRSALPPVPPERRGHGGARKPCTGT
ncbi:hypothetical protein [Amycolatopsis anabasis]|uniref:hypothetical protein n=1 Tax=Amycolatopsis anabasis TaxID=1840409 RepID=UPI00131C159A|nr:hypothetical protein [Amycolatopsis anabasis]